MKLLFLISSPPSAPLGPDNSFKNSLDAALTSAVFGQQVSLLFMGNGVQHLLPAKEDALVDSDQTTSDPERLEDYELQSYEIESYGIEEVYFQSSACPAQPLKLSHLNFAPRGLTDQQIGELLAAQTAVLHF
jgi:sulfur relay (sulfurtransferase) DsrF/TusC family protein